MAVLTTWQLTSPLFNMVLDIFLSLLSGPVRIETAFFYVPESEFTFRVESDAYRDVPSSVDCKMGEEVETDTDFRLGDFFLVISGPHRTMKDPSCNDTR